MGLKSLIVRIKGDSKGLDKSLKKSEKSVGKFGKSIKRLGGLLAGAFAVSKVIQFGKEAVKVAAKAEGIEKAFRKLNDPNLLNNLREATRGTVSDIELMQKAVQAKNFKIPLDQLATYFKFATNRAIETGESVDYLVESIITGIGRKSVLVMDNLGISAVELQEETKRLGDFGAAAGEIISKSLRDAGDVADTTATSIASIGAKWENLKRRVGEALIESGVLDDLIKAGEALAEGALALINPRAALMMKDSADLQQMLTDSKEREAQVNGWILEDEKELEGLGKLKLAQRWELKKLIKDEKRQLEKELELQRQINDVLALRKSGKETPVPTRTNVSVGKISGKGIGPTIIPKGDQLRAAGTAAGVEYSDAWYQAMQEETARWDMTQLLQDSIMQLSSAVADLVGGAFEAAFSGGDDIGKDLLAGFADFLGQFGQLLVAYGIANTAFFQSLAAGPLGGPLAIAAGLSAIAIAGAIKGALSKGADAMSGSSGSYGSKGGYGSGKNYQPQQLAVKVKGEIKGRDIYISNQRYTSSLNTRT